MNSITVTREDVSRGKIDYINFCQPALSLTVKLEIIWKIKVG